MAKIALHLVLKIQNIYILKKINVLSNVLTNIFLTTISVEKVVEIK